MRLTQTMRADLDARRARMEAEQHEREWTRLESAPKPREFHGPDVVQRPHPDSYGAHLPLRPQNFRDMTRTTADERATLAARPLSAKRYATPDDLVDARAREMMDKAGLDYWRERARKELAETLRLHARADARATELSLSFHH